MASAISEHWTVGPTGWPPKTPPSPLLSQEPATPRGDWQGWFIRGIGSTAIARRH
jgi:hypothetical protein